MDPEGLVTTALGSVALPDPGVSSAIDATLGVTRITAAPAAAPAVPWRNARRLVPSIVVACGIPPTAIPAGMATGGFRNERRVNLFILCSST
jgi:hypothetical protein